MIVPSGKGLPARYASIALSLPITTRMSLSSPASWAAEMNFQSRYPGGIVVTMICLATLLSVCVLVSAVAFPAVMPVLSCPNDEGVIHAATPVTVTTATNKSAIRFMVPPAFSLPPLGPLDAGQPRQSDRDGVVTHYASFLHRHDPGSSIGEFAGPPSPLAQHTRSMAILTSKRCCCGSQVSAARWSRSLRPLSRTDS